MNRTADKIAHLRKTALEHPEYIDVLPRLGNADVPLEAEDLATLHLDLLAGKEGFERGK
jgi:formate dehydrogenase maturation protein FdhE